MDIQAWNIAYEAQCQRNLQAFLNNETDSYAILQLKRTDETAQERFMNYSWLENKDREPDVDHYDVVYTGSLPSGTSLEDIYVKFNVSPPEKFTGHSLSVSDIVALKQSGVVSCHYVDSIGFRKLPNFHLGKWPPILKKLDNAPAWPLEQTQKKEE